MPERTLMLVGTAHAHTPDHARVVAEEQWAITRVFDRDHERRQRWCDELGAEPADAIAPDGHAPQGIDGVIICGETCHREADISAALNAGLPVFTEKPLAGTGAAARRLADLAERSGVLLDTGYFLRTNPTLTSLRAQVRDGTIGQVLEAHLRFAHDGAYADWLDVSGWMTDPEMACFGGFGDEVVHVLDWLLWTLGPVASSKILLGHALDAPVDDHGTALLQMDAGAQVVLAAGWTDIRLRLEIDIVGTKGQATLRDGQARVLTRDGGEEPIWEQPLATLDAGEGLRPFLGALERGDRTGLIRAADAAAVSAALERIYGS